ncbi:restriction endonuclease subunit S [Stutzerimonas xanthomarina]|uniref:restriction endonuclease subunit S n=1 Tax=Stutzerimonas xanthomarina TaxID=271420 RepID=UPI003AA9DF5A
MSPEVNRKVKFKKLLIESVRNGIYKQKEFHGRGCKIINMGELFSFPRLHDVSMKRVELTEKEQSKSLVQQGDLLFARRSLVAEGAGRCSIVREVNEPTTFESSIIRARPNPALVSSDYLYYFFSSRLGRELMGTILRQMAVSGITGSDLMELEIECPELEKQKAIAAFLSALDDRITLLRETNVTLEAIAQALFKSWFVDFDPVHAKAEGREPEGMDATTAALFPESFEESELGLVPKGWTVARFGDFINRLSVGQKYDQKSASTEGTVPVLDQGKSGIIGYHNDSPGVKASLETPVVVFANHTCYMRLITFDFSAIQNVLPFNGRGVDTVWAFYATKDRVKFSEYKGHWPNFAIEKSVLPPAALTYAFRDVVDPVIRKIRFNELQAQTLTQLRDTLLPRLISGQLRLPEAEALLEGSL